MTRRVAALPAVLALAGCSGVQSVLDPAGIQAERVANLWWFMFAVAGAVFVAVVAAMLYAALGRRAVGGRRTAEEVRREARITVLVSVATAATTLILFAFLIVNFSTERAMASLPGDQAVSVKITGMQWWWKIEYVDSVANRRLVTANELHIPVGAPIKIELESQDVIHSFWVPRLHGKLDLVPGYRNVLWLRADSAGVYRGQCAEFCGHQHAKMGITVVAHSRAEFDAWLAHQREPAPEPATEEQARGRDVYLQATCIMCHTIRGTPSGGHTGPDLTHIGSRGTIGAGTLPNTRGNMGGWILNPHSIKPGVKMPANTLSSSDLQALLTYLESLR